MDKDQELERVARETAYQIYNRLGLPVNEQIISGLILSALKQVNKQQAGSQRQDACGSEDAPIVSEGGSNPRLAPVSPSAVEVSPQGQQGEETGIVPFHLAKIPSHDKVVLLNGSVYELTNNRRIEVWHIKGDSGLCVRIFRPTDDGKTSKLLFGLDSDAAATLMIGLRSALSVPSLGPVAATQPEAGRKPQMNESITDTQRLDWLQKHCWEYYDESVRGVAPFGQLLFNHYQPTMHLRKAIDEAMSSAAVGTQEKQT